VALVSTDWLAEHLDDPTIRIVDIRGKVLTPKTRSDAVLDHYADYTQSHIPNAAFVNWVEDITDDPQHKRVTTPEAYARAMRRLGLNENLHIIAYDDAGHALAARFWWSLHYYGHPNVSVLDGGWNKWINEGRPVTTEVPQIEPEDFEAVPNRELLRSGDEILQLLSSTTRIVDMRLPEEYSGEMSLARFSGHIPGAVNLPANTLVTEDGSLLEPEMLRERFVKIGVDEGAPEVIFYGNVGVASCVGILAMRMAKLTPHAANYDASWQEWGNDDRKPLE